MTERMNAGSVASLSSPVFRSARSGTSTLALLVVTVLLHGTSNVGWAQGLQSGSAPPNSAAERAQAADEEGPTRMSTEGLDDDQARTLYRVAKNLYDAGRYREAGEEFEAAYELSRRPALLYNAYVAFRDGGDLRSAAENLRRFLEADPSNEQATTLAIRLRSMEDTVATMEQEARQREASAQAAQQAAAVQARQELLESQESHGPSPMRVTGFSLIGLGGAALVAGAATGILALNTQSDIDDSCPNNSCAVGYDLQGEEDRLRAFQISTDVLVFGGAAIIASGIALVLLSPNDEERTDSASADSKPEVGGACGVSGCMATAQMRF
ncbi:MAG: hypothetical protein AAF550_11835 [Myxococcota bacterium]